MPAARRTTDDLPPEAVLVNNVRTRAGSIAKELTIREATRRIAAMAPEGAFSEGTWRNIENGRTRASDKQLVLIGLVLGIEPDQLADAGRDEAARLLREEIERRATRDPVLAGVSELTSERVVMALLRKLDDIRSSPEFSEPDKREMEKTLLADVMARLQKEEPLKPPSA
ncbi:hypothetical protein GCM10010466_39500 [Planomonospora alba]|uniref:HTH cro/C1-type domain-containing protein n=1 Tax=Planomonospora alba TaxID=161354 RepID=A0ABP6NDL1_9ACTN